MPSKFRHLMDPLEPRRLLAAQHPLSVNFTDEALWDSDFPTAVQQAKSLGITAVRLWLGFTSYDDRPNAWDNAPPFFGMTSGTVSSANPDVDPPSLVMERAFQLHDLGFSVMLVVEPNAGITPTSDAQVAGLFDHLMTATETPTSTRVLASVVDYWEIGNEPDQGAYWQPSATNKTAGLQSYVDDYLIPAATELHNFLPTPEKVVSAGVSGNPSDLNTILTELNAKHAMSLIDYAGFHPYGTYDPTNSSVPDTILTNTNLAVQYASAYGKQLIATEWNVRGFNTSGSQNATWASAMDYIYRNVIAPNYAGAYYFDMINNYAARGGTTSARPGGLLTHQSPITVTPSSQIPDLTTYYNSPLVPSNPFYSTFNAWQYGNISGVVTDQSGAAAASTTVYIDLNNNGAFDAGEPSTTSGTTGAYMLTYSVGTVAPGSYSVRIATSSPTTPVVGSITESLTNLENLTNVNFSVSSGSTGVATLGTVVGALWNDTDGDGTVDGNEGPLSGWSVYLDLNGNGQLDSGEPNALSGANGSYTLSYDTSKTTATSAKVCAVTPTGWQLTATPTVSLVGGSTQTGVLVGARATGAVATTGAISGYLFGDGNGDGIKDGTDAFGPDRVVYIDTNGNGKLDTGELQTTSDANGNYSFTGLKPGTYNVTRVFPAGYHISNSATPYITATVGAGLTTTVNIGSVSNTTTPTPPATTPTPSPTATTGTISGYLFSDANGDGIKDGTDAFGPDRVVFIDTNGNGKLDSGEKQTTSDANGNYSFTGLKPGTYNVTRVFPSGYHISNSTTADITVTVVVGQTTTVNIGSASNTTTPTPPPTTPTPPPTTTGNTPAAEMSISGYLFNDGDGDGLFNGLNTFTADRVVFIDTNGNGKLDAGEVQTTSDANGRYSFTGLKAGTYNITRVFPSGYHISNSTKPDITVTLKTGQSAIGVDIGTTNVTSKPINTSSKTIVITG